MMRRSIIVLVSALTIAACAAMDGPYTDHDVASDFAPVDWTMDGKADTSGVPAVFDPNNLMTDAVFTATSAVDGDAIQQFLEMSPYGVSWLATEMIGNQRFADAVVSIASARGIDPVLLLVRVQVESSLVSATTAPSDARLAIALGCGCPDSSTTCSSSDLGLGTQLTCAAEVLSDQFAASQNGTGQWRIAQARTTSDGVTVTPIDNATAALYAYTPWVLVDTGGNWLVWNITRRFLKQFDSAGTLNL